MRVYLAMASSAAGEYSTAAAPYMSRAIASIFSCRGEGGAGWHDVAGLFLVGGAVWCAVAPGGRQGWRPWPTQQRLCAASRNRSRPLAIPAKPSPIAKVTSLRPQTTLPTPHARSRT